MAKEDGKKDGILEEDIKRTACSEMIDWEKLCGRRILVTGATGLIGSAIVRSLVYAGTMRKLDIRVTALVRSCEKGEALFGGLAGDGIKLLKGDILDLPDIEQDIDYIVHGAGMTASKDFVDRPVETIRTAVKGTENVLELARLKDIKGMVYLSSMEVYGTADAEHYNIHETDYGYIDPLQVRSSYSEGKRMCEGLCAAYAHEYKVPVKIARPAQTFGAGISRNENRVFAQFARSIIEGKDIVLHTDGSKAHCYCYTTDAVTGILKVLLEGNTGEAYNISNEDTYCTIREMAEMLIDRYPLSGSKLIFDISEDADKYGYAPSSRMMVNSEKLRSLGWKAQVGLPEMFDRLIKSMSQKEVI